MGDRGNIVIRQRKLPKGTESTDIYFYTHWTGSALPHILQKALDRGRPRWNDPSYLSRIIFSEMIQDEVMDETGYGIALFAPDNEHEFLVVNMDEQYVALHAIGARHGEIGSEIGRWVFDHYCRLDLSAHPWEQLTKSLSLKTTK